MNRSTCIHRFVLISVAFILVIGISLFVYGGTEEGINSYSIGEFEKAGTLFKEALKHDPSDVHAGYYLGLSLIMQKKYGEALGIFQDLKGTIKNKTDMNDAGFPTKGQVEIALSRAYIGLKQYPEVMERLKEAEKTNADPVDIHTYKGAYYLEINEISKAQEELDMALKMNTQNAYTFYYAGILYLRSGDPKKAVELLKVFLELAPYAPEAVNVKFLVDTLC